MFVLADGDPDPFADNVADGRSAGGGLDRLHVHVAAEQIATRELGSGFGGEVQDGLDDDAWFARGGVNISRVGDGILLGYARDGDDQVLDPPAFEQVGGFEKSGGMQIIQKGGSG